MPVVQANNQMRGIRGAVTAAADTPAAIVAATQRLLAAIVRTNRLQLQDVAAVFFTTTADLTSEFPAAACRASGWERVPLLCSTEIAVPGSLQSCIRVLLLVNSSSEQGTIQHVYLDGAAALRPDLAGDSR